MTANQNEQTEHKFLKRIGMRPLTESFSVRYRNYREAFKNKRPRGRYRHVGDSGPLHKDVTAGELDAALKKVLNTYSFERSDISVPQSNATSQKLASILEVRQKLIDDPQNRLSSDLRPETLTVRTIQSFLNDPSKMAFRSWEILLEWIESELFLASLAKHALENMNGKFEDETGDDAILASTMTESQTRMGRIEELRTRMAALEGLRSILAKRPGEEDFAQALQDEYAARVFAEGIRLLDADGKDYLMRTLLLLLESVPAPLTKASYPPDMSDDERDNKRNAERQRYDDAARLAGSIVETNLGLDVSPRQLVDVITGFISFGTYIKRYSSSTYSEEDLENMSDYLAHLEEDPFVSAVLDEYTRADAQCSPFSTKPSQDS